MNGSGTKASLHGNTETITRGSLCQIQYIYLYSLSVYCVLHRLSEFLRRPATWVPPSATWVPLSATWVLPSATWVPPSVSLSFVGRLSEFLRQLTGSPVCLSEFLCQLPEVLRRILEFLRRFPELPRQSEFLRRVSEFLRHLPEFLRRLPWALPAAISKAYVWPIACFSYRHYGTHSSLHCKKMLAIFPSPAGMSLTKLSLGEIFPAQGEFSQWHPGWGRENG